MSSQLVRRAGVVLAGGGIYAGSVAAFYYYMTAGQADQKETSRLLEQNAGFSYVEDPHRARKFQDVAEFYDSQIGRDESFMGINLLRRALLYFHAKGTVLEMGAGTGRNVNYYPSSVDRVLMTDSSDQMLMQARKKINDLSGDDRSRFACLESDALDLDFPDSCFDTVVDTFGLCSYDDPVAVLREMSRVCRPGGKILLLEHGRSKTWEGLSNYLDRNAERHAKNWGCVWNRDLDEIVEKAGLQMDRLDTWHFGTTYYMVCRPGKQTDANIKS
mmetsp:Transcript_16903/g.26196  ORF Transcript_16903/g.26196 Transcript_16903/m.26196 type:complete len:273 (-) Transcript_16903:257-1075(-)|eukprot:CAMPEP_0195302988 /NCGR_PEP_ID=MMETSP0707-20130614/32047_1 /TAXON_ID=33640 /ORGANISM="Asterionellopsis glacialis, Strain CCMP134" /LENGTH=272 /DNA_ID=CAMNT_0040366395 /DNA_START=85 /DNA_END=903 /DNA_ORIENTATION=+